MLLNLGPYVQTDEIEVKTYENQRWNAVSGLMGLRNGFSNVLLPSDRPRWSNRTGRISLPREQFICNNNCYWLNKWRVDFSILNGCDDNGWQYAIDFPRFIF